MNKRIVTNQILKVNEYIKGFYNSAITESNKITNQNTKVVST